MTAPLSRRSFLRMSSLAAGAAAIGAPLLGEREMAMAAMSAGMQKVAATSPNAVMINFNENPLGPSEAARKAAVELLPQAGRYLHPLQDELAELLARQLGLSLDAVDLYAGSGIALDATTMAFTGPDAPLVVADPSYEQPTQMAAIRKAPVHKVPLRKDYSHDVKAMAGAASNAGLIYICNPNNPTGTVTTRADIEWLLANKPKGAVVLVDEAYIHFSDAPSVLDLVAAGKDLVVLRTFSKLYGMAGMRLGVVAARPDLLARIQAFRTGGGTALPVMTVAAAIASLKEPGLVAQRKQLNASVRDDTIGWLRSKGYACTPSQSNCFMVDVRRPGPGFAAQLAARDVVVGRSWPVWPNHMRISVGTAEEMRRFKTAFAAVIDGKVPVQKVADTSHLRSADFLALA
ncbi:pyridoxal phosphate-dependent aminotransferase [Frateuria defendens]|uniref:pyridoxal phosphate-dependent aminotransferase n=1 Tax=Frateuria defendens TaxID=2219559 RepID=UPI00066FD114|nr:pyridoxal phosphate-dependent aminotransferase [Frateuria defendens]